MNVLFILGKRLFLTISKKGKDIRNPYIGALGIMFYFCRCKEMNRRTKKVLGMKTKFLGVFLMMWAMIGLEAGCNSIRQTRRKCLLQYFSWSGNTRNLAHQIQGLTGGDLFEIETVKAYPEKYRSCTEYAKKEKEADARPALKSKVKDMDAYDVVYVGFPNWWGTGTNGYLEFLGGV